MTSKMSVVPRAHVGVFSEFGSDAKVWDTEKDRPDPRPPFFIADERANRNVDIPARAAKGIKYFLRHHRPS